MSLPPSDRPPTCLAHFVAALKGRMGLTNGGESTYRSQLDEARRLGTGRFRPRHTGNVPSVPRLPMRLSWSATNLGTRLGLSSGTAVLVREEEKSSCRRKNVWLLSSRPIYDRPRMRHARA